MHGVPDGAVAGSVDSKSKNHSQPLPPRLPLLQGLEDDMFYPLGACG